MNATGIPVQNSSDDRDRRAVKLTDIPMRWNVRQGLQLKGLRSSRLSSTGSLSDSAAPKRREIATDGNSVVIIMNVFIQ